MCGHDTIGVATALIESGIITPREPFTNIALDTPAGVVTVKVRVEGNVACEVTFTNAPSFVFARDVEIDVPSIGPVTTDVAWGGLYYAIVDARDVGLTLCAAERRSILRIGVQVREAVNARIKVFHPEKTFVDQVTHVLFSAPTDNPSADLQNAVVIPPGSVCRSPCGTGTCAKLAQLYARGELALNQPFGHESATTQTVFTARVLEETAVGDFPAVVTDVTGSAYVTGMHTFVVDPDDPLQRGFSFL